MKLVNRNEKANLILSSFVFCAMIVFLYSCGDGGSGGSSPETGTVSFGLIMQGSSDTSLAQYFRGADDSAIQFECSTDAYEISTIEAEVFDENGELLTEGGPWDCEDHHATLSDVEAGDGRIVKIYARDESGKILYGGVSEPVTVIADETVNAGEITLVRAGTSIFAGDDSSETDEDEEVIIPVDENDTESYFNVTDNEIGTIDPGSLTIEEKPKNGTAVANGDGTVSYNPNSEFFGDDSFTYTVQDDLGVTSNSATVKMTVIPKDDPVIAVDDSGFATDEDTPLTTGNVLANDSAADGGKSVVPGAVSSANGASVTLSTDGTFSYDPTNAPTIQTLAEGAILNDTFSYTARDADVDTDTAVVTVAVTGVNDAPRITSTAPTIATEDIEYAYNPTATDAEGNTLSWSLVNAPSGMVIDAGTGAIRWTPLEGILSSGQVTLGARDGIGGTGTETFTVSVKPVNDAPRITSTAPTIATEDIEYAYNPTATDAEGNTLSWSLVNAPSGMVIDAGTGAIRWTPLEGILSSGQVTLGARDGIGGTGTETFTVSVKPVNDAPRITSTAPTIATEDIKYTYTPRLEDAESDTLQCSLENNPAGMVVDVATGVVTWTPLEGVLTSGLVTLTVSDGKGGANTEDFTVTVNPVLDAPINISVVAGVKQVIISWEPADEEAESYNIYWLTSPEIPPVSKTNYTDRIRIPDTSTSYTHTGLENRTSYYYVVTAVNSFDESEESSEVSATTWYGAFLDGDEDDVGQYSSIALNDTDMPVISYYDVSNGILKVARVSFRESEDSVESVFREIADNGIGEGGENDVGQHTSIAVLSDDGVDAALISYYDATDQYIKLAVSCNFNPNNCPDGYSISVFSSSNTGPFSSVSLDPSGAGGGISFYDAETGDLMWGGGVPTKTIDSEGDVGKYTSFYRFGIGDSPQNHISYYDETNGDLKYVAFNDTSELISGETIDSTGDVGQYTSIAVDSDGNAHISYYDATNGDLKYARYTPGDPPAITIEIVDGDGDVGRYSSIALDLDDKVYISYYDAVNRDLKYATNASGTWSVSTLDSIGDVGGWFTSIALESNDNGYPHISYYDATNGRLKYATLSPTITVDNVAPVADAGTSLFQRVDLPFEVELNGGGSSDDNSDPLTYNWTFTSRPEGSTATLTAPTPAEPTATFVADVYGTYEVQLIVNDGTVDSNPDFVMRTVAPVIGVIVEP